MAYYINSYNHRIFKNLNFSKYFLIPLKFKKFFKSEFICLHLRRGDYISNKKSSRYHGNLTNKYYINSVNFIRSKFKNLPVLIFTDDPKWAENNLQPYINNSHLISSEFQNAEIDFLLMTKAKYFIISNSTFHGGQHFINKKNKFIIIQESGLVKEK